MIEISPPQGRARSLAVVDQVSKDITAKGYSLLPADTTLELLGCSDLADLADWSAFRDSWEDMPLDVYMADGGKYRRRRHATLSIHGSDAQLRRVRHQPHYQSLDFNHLNGGVERWFEPIDDDILTGATLSGLVNMTARVVGLGEEPGRDLRIETHQFRIEIDESSRGLPTPEGRHRDGVDMAIMVLVNRVNVTGGSTTISDLEGRELAQFTLLSPLDMAIVDDRRVYHEVSAIQRGDDGGPSHRDVLVATFKHADQSSESS